MANRLGEIRPATLDDLRYVGRHMRPDDAREVYAQALLSPDEAVETLGFEGEAWAGVVDGRPFAIFGVVPPYALTRTVMPWLLATAEIERHAIPFLRHSRRIVRRWKAEHGALENYVDARNVQSIEWLRWLGFTIEPPMAHGPLARAFHRFHL